MKPLIFIAWLICGATLWWLWMDAMAHPSARVEQAPPSLTIAAEALARLTEGVTIEPMPEWREVMDR